MKTIRWGIVGCGDVTEIKSGPGFQKASGSALVAVMRRNAALAEDYAKRHGVARWYDDAHALIRDPEVDAVYIASPPGTHLELALEVCAAGKPALVEKPMVRSHAEGCAMVEAFHKEGLPLYVAFYRRALPRFLKAKELIDGGKLGRIVTIHYRFAKALHLDDFSQGIPWRVDAVHSGGGIFFDLGSHTLDILDFLCGPIAESSGMAANLASAYEVEDTVAMQFRTCAGALGTASWSFANGGPDADLIEITGTDGKLSLSTFGSDPVVFETKTERETFAIANPPHIHQPLIQSIVEELRGVGRCPSTGESALRTAKVMDQVVSNYYGGRNDAFWNRSATWPGLRKAGR